MIANDQELKSTLDRIAQFQVQIAHLCVTRKPIPSTTGRRYQDFLLKSTVCSSKCANILVFIREG